MAVVGRVQWTVSVLRYTSPGSGPKAPMDGPPLSTAKPHRSTKEHSLTPSAREFRHSALLPLPSWAVGAFSSCSSGPSSVFPGKSCFTTVFYLFTLHAFVSTTRYRRHSGRSGRKIVTKQEHAPNLSNTKREIEAPRREALRTAIEEQGSKSLKF